MAVLEHKKEVESKILSTATLSFIVTCSVSSHYILYRCTLFYEVYFMLIFGLYYKRHGVYVVLYANILAIHICLTNQKGDIDRSNDSQ